MIFSPVRWVKRMYRPTKSFASKTASPKTGRHIVVQQPQRLSSQFQVPHLADAVVVYPVCWLSAALAWLRFPRQADLNNDLIGRFLDLFDLYPFHFQQFCAIIFLGQSIHPTGIVILALSFYLFVAALSSFFSLTPTFIIEPKCLKRIFGVFACISVLISSDLAPLSLRKNRLENAGKSTRNCISLHFETHSNFGSNGMICCSDSVYAAATE